MLLEKLKQESHFTLRAEAAEAIVRIDPTKAEEVVKVLIAATRSDDSGNRLFALAALLEVIEEVEGVAGQVRPALQRAPTNGSFDLENFVFCFGRKKKQARERACEGGDCPVRPTSI